MTRKRSSARHSDAEREASLRRYRELVEHSLGLICVHDLDGTLLFVNPTATRALGYEPGEWPRPKLPDFLAPSVRDQFNEYIARIRRHGIDSGLMRVVRKDGEERVWMYRNILHDEPPEPPRVLGHAIDVTERVQAERALHKSQDALTRTLAELDLRVQERTAELQLANERLRGEIRERQRAEEMRERLLVRERENLAFWTTVNKQLAAVVDYEGTLRTVAALPVPYLADWSTLHVLHKSGMCRCVVGRHTDHARQPALERLAARWSGVLPPHCSVAQVLASGRPEAVLPGPEALAARLVGRAGDADLIQSLGGQAVAVVPLTIGDHVVGALSMVAADPGRFSGIDAAALDDLARRFSLAIDRARLYRDAHEANRLKDEFLATLSHELRTPLNAVLGWARILRTRPLDQPATRAADVIERNADALTRLVEDLLDVSRIITGKLMLNQRPVELPAVLSAAIDSIRPAARAKGIRLLHDLPQVPLVTGDEHRLQQVFWNLLANAVKFTGSGGAITVAVQRTGDAVTVAVADTGVGIRREMVPFVFDRFRQADASSTRAQGGLGLGLAIVRHIVELHGGSVRVDSVEGQGATFTVELPAAAPAGAVALRHAPADPVGWLAATQLLSGTRVLIVDDDPDARDLVAEIIRSAGGTAATAASTSEALQAVSTFEPDALIADIALPHEDGYALIRKVRERAEPGSHPLVAIALTGYARAEDRARAFAAGFREHLAKPVEPEALIRAVRETLDAAMRADSAT